MSYTKNPRDSGLGLNEDFAPPPGPPPPIMPEGWVARFDERYQRFYYVNTYTKQSQWEKPPRTIDPPIPGRSPNDFDRPPAYSDGNNRREDLDWPVAPPNLPQKYDSLIPPQPQQQQQQYLQPPQSQAPTSGSSSPSRGLSGRLSSFLKSHAVKSPRPQQQQQQQYCYQQRQRPVYYGGGGPMMGGQRRPGMGAGGAAALGVGGGLLGGMLLADAIDNQYDQGFQGGQSYDEDYGGGEFGGGDMDFGGGDF